MSELKVNSIKGVSASTAAISIDNSSGTCTANITNNLSNRNLIINGAMQVAQRGTTSTADGIHTVDRFTMEYGGEDNVPTQEHETVAAGTEPYTSGFRRSFKVVNGNQTSGAGAGDYLNLQTKLEAQDIANSGWNYTSSSSYVTLSFWIRSTVAQNFKCYLRTRDGTEQRYTFDTGSLSADTWTKITKTISGNSNITINNDNGEGLQINIAAFWGTNFTDNSVTEDAWGAYSGSTRMKDNTSTWWTTNLATLQITGVQLEVGSVATDFEHRSFAQELALCQRYFYKIKGDSGDHTGIMGYFTQTAESRVGIHTPVPMRTAATYAGSGDAQMDSSPDSVDFSLSANTNTIGAQTTTENPDSFQLQCIHYGGSNNGGDGCGLRFRSNGAFISLSAEL